jgi:small-conductance mechanosensitive channel
LTPVLAAASPPTASPPTSAPPSTSTSGGLIYDFLKRHHATDLWAHTGQVLLVRVGRIVLIVVLAVIVARLAGGVVRHVVRGLRLRVGRSGTAVRADDRARTVGNALSGAVRTFIWVIAVLTILGELGINLAPFVAGATVVGAALGFGAQSLVRDFLSGFLIQVEDQYGVGDVITTGDTTGTVESLNFRTTRVRAVDGVVWYIPNGEIRKVGNTSDDYNRALVDVLLPWPVDVDRALAVVRDAAGAVAADPAYRDAVLEPPEVWGIDTVAVEGVTVRIAVKTKPADKAGVARALRGRVVSALQEGGLGWRPAAAVEATTPTPGEAAAGDPTPH